jgi:2-deoxy-D-gluconate 3-dehydrogenase
MRLENPNLQSASLFDLTGKVAIVTGSNTGLGAGMATALAAAGCDIVGANRSDPAETAARVEAAGRRFVDVRADLSSLQPIDSIVEAAMDTFGRVDVLVNNAGIIRRCDALEFSEADWDAVIDVNLKGVFFLSQAVARQFVQQGGRGKIINVASMLSFQGGIRVPSYTASKSGVLGLTRLLANEWAGRGINVNAIAPGNTNSDAGASLTPPGSPFRTMLENTVAMRVQGEPDELVGALLLLCSSAGDWITGQTLKVDGGWIVAP